MVETETLVCVYASNEMAQYLIAKSVLDRERIQYVAKGETLNSVFGAWSPHWSAVLGPAELWVRSGDRTRARELLREVGVRTDTESCRYCGSSAIAGRPWKAVIPLAFGFAVGAVLAAGGNEMIGLASFTVTVVVASVIYARAGRMRCRSCGRLHRTAG